MVKNIGKKTQLSIIVFILGAFLADGSYASYCAFGDEQEVRAVTINARTGAFSDSTDRRESIYNPPTGWTIVSHRVAEKARWGNTAFDVGVVAAESKFISYKDAERSYEYAIDLAGKYTDKYGMPRSVAGDLKEKMSTHLKAIYQAQSSHNALHVVAEARGHGKFSDRTSNVNAEVYATVRCIGDPNAEILQNALASAVDKERKCDQLAQTVAAVIANVPNTNNKDFETERGWARGYCAKQDRLNRAVDEAIASVGENYSCEKIGGWYAFIMKKAGYEKRGDKDWAINRCERKEFKEHIVHDIVEKIDEHR